MIYFYYLFLKEFSKGVIHIKEFYQLRIESVLASPRNSILYKVSDELGSYVLKVSRTPLSSDREAFEDEYRTMKNISHPVLPKYYAYYPAVPLPDQIYQQPAVLMEYVEGKPLTSIQHLTTKQLKKYILDLGDALYTLLKHGVLYMDLHPGNLLIQNGQIKLLDFTKAYYYLTNPNPSYVPKISYQINQLLPGQQILIQALTSLILHLPQQLPIHTIPQSLIQLGLHPHSGISFSDFLTRIENDWITD